MIRNDSEYERVRTRIVELERAIAQRRELLRRSRFADEGVDRELRELKTTCERLEHEITLYQSRIGAHLGACNVSQFS